ncbi:MAG: diguanylate cyclase [Elusimicrobiota bacterium]
MSKAKILIADNEPDILKVLELRLTSAGYNILRAENGKQALKKARKKAPDLILLDIMMPDFNGMEVMSALLKDNFTADIPVIFLTAKTSAKSKVNGINMGAYDYVTKPYDAKELISRINSVLQRKNHYDEMTMTDPLTGLHNRRFFKQQFSIFFNMAKRYDLKFSLVIFDVDDFKNINDTYGHSAGDFILKKIAETAKNTLRESDIILRYGGDEFIAIFPRTKEAMAKKTTEKIIRKISKMDGNYKGKNIPVKLSYGLSAYSEEIQDKEELFNRADSALYESKTKNSQLF